ncbi:MAG: iron-containing alcohol dehydrogenase [Youngiibacter sp.]|nr:iron-containing alcohol dehydrogenase [Youngiibacter sp.]
MSSVFVAANPILFGVGTSGELGKRAKDFGCSKALLIFDKGVEAAGISDKIKKNLEESGIEVVAYNGVQADPPDWSVEEAAKLGLENKVDCVIGLGGGSSIDTAKAANVLQTNAFPLKQYFGRFGAKMVPGLTLIVIPTTAGTGSECTPGGAITDTENNVKTNVNGVACIPRLGIVDPELTLGLPKSVTASTGMDALCHAIESYTSIWSNPFAGVMAEKAIKLVGRSFMRAYNDGPNDLDARIDMMEAATLGGMSMMGPLCHFGHDIGRALGAYYHVPHGAACAMTIPQVFEYIAPSAPEKVRFIANALGGQLPEDATPEEIGLEAKNILRNMMKETKMPTLQSLGLDLEDLKEKVPPNVLKMGLALAPAPTNAEVVKMLLEKAYVENVW